MTHTHPHSIEAKKSLSEKFPNINGDSTIYNLKCSFRYYYSSMADGIHLISLDLKYLNSFIVFIIPKVI